MIDIHSHILPAVDDGARDMDMAVEMCRMAASDGCTAIVATPHQRTPSWWNCDPKGLRSKLEALRAVLGSELSIHLGGEIRVSPGLLRALSEKDFAGALPLAGSNYLLLEFDRRGLGDLDAEGFTHELRLEGWTPVFAHPELNPDLAENLNAMRCLVDSGGLFQVTAMSLTGAFGKRPQRSTEGMIEAGLIHFVASDAHDLTKRPPGLRRAHDHLVQKYGEPVARRLTDENPRAILENRPISR